MIANGVGSFVNLIPVLLGVVLLGAALGGSFLSPGLRKQIEKYFLRPLAVLVLAAGLYWAGHETWRDLAIKHDSLLAALHIGLAAVIAWFSYDNLRRLIRSFGPQAPESPPEPPTPAEGAK